MISELHMLAVERQREMVAVDVSVIHYGENYITVEAHGDIVRMGGKLNVESERNSNRIGIRISGERIATPKHSRR